MTNELHSHRGVNALLLLAVATLLAACTVPSVVRAPSTFNPAGNWEYEEQGQSVVLTLDPQGNGTYPWKKGRFFTHQLAGRSWTGSWQQTGNNREGGFELTLSEDFSRAEGRWWYTRIGNDHSPTKTGGRFSLYRLSDEDLSDNPATY